MCLTKHLNYCAILISLDSSFLMVSFVAKSKECFCKYSCISKLWEARLSCMLTVAWLQLCHKNGGNHDSHTIELSHHKCQEYSLKLAVIAPLNYTAY